MQHTLAFAPTDKDLQDFCFYAPVITLSTPLAVAEPTEDPVEPDAAQAS